MNSKAIIELQRQFLFFVIDAAEASMTRDRFRPFKRLVFDHFHKVTKPALYLELGVWVEHSGQESQSEVGAVPNKDRKGVLP